MVVQLDLAGDAGADGGADEFRRMADADAVHALLAAERKGDDVAIGGEALAETVGDRQPLLARAQQNFGRAERAGGQHHGSWPRPSAKARRVPRSARNERANGGPPSRRD